MISNEHDVGFVDWDFKIELHGLEEEDDATYDVDENMRRFAPVERIRGPYE